MELKGDATCSARGLLGGESWIKGRGPVALSNADSSRNPPRVRDSVCRGISERPGEVNMDKGERLKEAGPSSLIEVIGLWGFLGAGDQLVVVKDERLRGKFPGPAAKAKDGGPIHSKTIL